MSSRNSLVAAAVLLALAGCLSVNVTINTQPQPKSEQPPAKKTPDPCVQARPSWPEDFESYAAGPGAWPDTWIADANAQDHSVSYVDGETFEATHGKTLRLHADDASWSAIAYAPVSLGPSFNVSFDAYSTQGCMGIGLRERPSWTAPGLGLFGQWTTGLVYSFAVFNAANGPGFVR